LPASSRATARNAGCIEESSKRPSMLQRRKPSLSRSPGARPAGSARTDRDHRCQAHVLHGPAQARHAGFDPVDDTSWELDAHLVTQHGRRRRDPQNRLEPAWDRPADTLQLRAVQSNPASMPSRRPRMMSLPTLSSHVPARGS
jgi:hypothetical protein